MTDFVGTKTITVYTYRGREYHNIDEVNAEREENHVKRVADYIEKAMPFGTNIADKALMAFAAALITDHVNLSQITTPLKPLVEGVACITGEIHYSPKKAVAQPMPLDTAEEVPLDPEKVLNVDGKEDPICDAAREPIYDASLEPIPAGRIVVYSRISPYVPEAQGKYWADWAIGDEVTFIDGLRGLISSFIRHRHGASNATAADKMFSIDMADQSERIASPSEIMEVKRW